MIKWWHNFLWLVLAAALGTVLYLATREQPAPPTPVDIVSLDFDRNVTDDSLKQLADVQNLRKLRLPGSLITDDGLKHLAAHTGLKDIDLGVTLVSDTGVDDLVKLSNLESVGLSGTRLSDKGVAKLASLPKLRTLNIGYTKVTDLCLEHLAATGVKELMLYNTDVGDAGLLKVAELGGLQQLTKLDLRGCKVTDNGIKALKALPELFALDINGPITDAAVDDLAAIPKLTVLYIEKSSITALGIARLKSLRPGLKVKTLR